MKMILNIALCLSLFLSTTVGAATPSNQCSMFPANKMRFPVKPGQKITRPQFRKMLDAAKDVYQPIFEKTLGKFYVVDMWYDDQVNACASKGLPCAELMKGKQPTPASKDFHFVEIYGGLARHPEMTMEGLMLVLCHEIGHHLAGYPRYDQNTDAMATEGQSDYFATAKCARTIYEAMSPKTHENWIWANKNRIPKEAAAPCFTNFPQPNDVNAIYCTRSALAGLSLAKVLMSAGGGSEYNSLSFTKKDATVVPVTYESHPQPQCRLDTYVAGALCQVHHDIPFSISNPTEGACVIPREGATRPKCWYKEPNLARRRI